MKRFELPGKSVEEQANFEGNDTLLFYERLKNPKIKKQLVDLLCEYYAAMIPPQTREQIEKKLDEAIEKVFSVTALDYNPKGTSDSRGIEINGEQIDCGTVAPFSKHFETGEPWTAKQLSIIEAHEKGHGIRFLSDPDKNLEARITSGLDFSKMVIDDRFRAIWLEVNADYPEGFPDEKVDRDIIEYFSRPSEIIERMAQLKNYFGMIGEEEFTKRHLDYAKDHYLVDTGIGIQMKPFLDAITSENETRFIELINSLGV